MKKFIRPITEELFINENELPKPLPKEEAHELIKKMKDGDEQAKIKLIEHNIRFVRYEVTHKFRNIPYNQKELVSIGIEGLLKAINHFDPEKGVEFATFASRCIDNEILMFLRTSKKYSSDVSLTQPLHIDKEGDVVTFEDIVSADVDILEEYIMNEEQKQVREIVMSLPTREKEIIMLFYGFYDRRYTQPEIAEMFGISQPHVCRLITKIVKKIGEQLNSKNSNTLVTQKNQVNRSEDNTKRVKYRKRKYQNIYEYFNNYPKEKIDNAISKLTEEEQKIAFLYPGRESNSIEVVEIWNKEYKNKFYYSIVPKLKRLLANPKSKPRKLRRKQDLIVKKEENINLESTSNDKEKTPTFGQLLSTFSVKEAIIISLRLGLVDGKIFNTETIAQFLGITENEVRKITRKALLVYKENMDVLLDSTIETTIERNRKR